MTLSLRMCFKGDLSGRCGNVAPSPRQFWPRTTVPIFPTLSVPRPELPDAEFLLHPEDYTYLFRFVLMIHVHFASRVQVPYLPHSWSRVRRRVFSPFVAGLALRRLR